MRIRSIKPDFYTDEDLQDLEIANPGRYVMMVFAGLWGASDKQGVFEWRPRSLKLSILPFLPFEMSDTLAVLERAEFIYRFTVAGKEYGYIPTFGKHQRINGKEAQAPALYPTPPPIPPSEAPGKQPGSTGEATETTGREGKGREKEEERNLPAKGEEVVTPPAEPAAAAAVGAGVSIQLDDPLAVQIIKQAVNERAPRLRELFPHADIGVETEKLCAKYRDGPVLDAGLLVLSWFQKVPVPKGLKARLAHLTAEQIEAHNDAIAAEFTGGVTDG